MDRNSISWFTKAACGLGILLWLSSLATAQSPNAVPISSAPVVTTYATLAANAPVRVCLSTSTGTPCSTVGVQLYSDDNLMQPIGNPTSTSAQGTYSFFIDSRQYNLPQLFAVQVTTTPGKSYTYYLQAQADSGTPGGSDTDVQVNVGGVFGGYDGLRYDPSTGLFVGDGYGMIVKPLGTPLADWYLDITTPETAMTSLTGTGTNDYVWTWYAPLGYGYWAANGGGGTVNSGTTGQIAYYPANGTAVSGDNTSIYCPSTDTVAQCVALLPSNGGLISFDLTSPYLSGYPNDGVTCLSKPNVTLAGLGMPLTGTTGMLAGTGTIIQGILPVCADQFSAHDLGVDVGTAVITAYYGGIPSMGLEMAYAFRTSAPYKKPTIYNVSTIGYSAAALVHDDLFENIKGGDFQNLVTKYGNIGVVIKGTDWVLDGLTARGHNAGCLVIKGDTFTATSNGFVNNVDCSFADAANDTGAGIDLTTSTGSGGTQIVSNITIDGVTCGAFVGQPPQACIVTDPTNATVANIVASHVQSIGTGYGVILNATGSYITSQFKLSNSILNNSAAEAISIPIGVQDTTIESTQINFTGAVAGIYNNGQGTVLNGVDVLNPAGNIAIYNDSAGTLTAHNISGGYKVHNISGAVYNGCPVTGDITGEFQCSMTIGIVTGPPGGILTARGASGATYDFDAQNAAGTHNNFLISDNGDTTTYGTEYATALTLNGGTPMTGQSSANSQIVTCPTGGTTTQYCDAAGAWVSPPTRIISAAVTSATGGTNTGTVTCLTAACTNISGTYSVVGSTFTTGTFLTLVWPTTTTAYNCWTSQNGGIATYGIGHSVATATGMVITAGITPATVTVTIDYGCSQY